VKQVFVLISLFAISAFGGESPFPGSTALADGCVYRVGSLMTNVRLLKQDSFQITDEERASLIKAKQDAVQRFERFVKVTKVPWKVNEVDARAIISRMSKEFIGAKIVVWDDEEQGEGIVFYYGLVGNGNKSLEVAYANDLYHIGGNSKDYVFCGK